jgi:hypothetical protein
MVLQHVQPLNKGEYHFWFGNPGGHFHPFGRVIVYNIFAGIALGMWYFGNTAGGPGLLSKFLDILPLEMLGAPQKVYECLAKIGFFGSLLSCHPSPVAKINSLKLGIPVAQIQAASVVGVCLYGFLYHNGFHEYDIFDAVLIAFGYGYGEGFYLQANAKFRKPLMIMLYGCLRLWLECLNAGVSKITNFPGALLGASYLFGLMAFTSQKGGSGGRGRSASKSRSRSRSRR